MPIPGTPGRRVANRPWIISICSVIGAHRIWSARFSHTLGDWVCLDKSPYPFSRDFSGYHFLPAVTIVPTCPCHLDLYRSPTQEAPGTYPTPPTCQRASCLFGLLSGCALSFVREDQGSRKLNWYKTMPSRQPQVLTF